MRRWKKKQEGKKELRRKIRAKNKNAGGDDVGKGERTKRGRGRRRKEEGIGGERNGHGGKRKE